jgi:stage III sporulation protein AG
LIKVKSRFEELLKKPKFLQTAVIIGIAAMMIIFISGLVKKPQATPSSTAEINTFAVTDLQFKSAEEYAESTAKSLSEILSQIKGVGDAEVLVTVGASEEYVYASDKKQSGSGTSSEVVIIDGSGSKKALTERINRPKITGVVIVCEGGDDSRTVEKVYRAVFAATGVGASRIYVAKLD